MVLIVIAVLIVIVSILLASIRRDNGRLPDWQAGSAICLGVIGGVFLFILLIAIPINRLEIKAKIQHFNAVQATIDTARAGGREIESAALVFKIVDCNTWLARQQYWKNHYFGIYYPGEIMELQPLK